MGKERIRQMEIFLIRHGETVDNKEGRYRGWTESSLSPEGKLQAELVAKALEDWKIDKLYSSDLERALHTAQAIGQRCRLEPVTSPLLREINFGIFEGMTYEEIISSYEDKLFAWLDNPFEKSPPEGEDLGTVCRRMQSFVDQLNHNNSSAKVALVCHGGIIRTWLFNLLNWGKEEFWNLSVANASISLVSYTAGNGTVVYHNYTEHLT